MYEKPAKPEPPLAPLELTPEAKAKGYYLWAPGSHKRFNWLRTPYEYGFEDSVHITATVQNTKASMPPRFVLDILTILFTRSKWLRYGAVFFRF